MALSDPSINVEICAFQVLRRMEGRSDPSLLCLYSLSELTDEWLKQICASSHIHSFTCAHTLRTRTRSHWDTVFQSFYLSLSHTIRPRPLVCTLKWQCQFPTFFFYFSLFSARHRFGGLSDSVWTLDANTQEMTHSTQYRVSMITCAPRGGCSKSPPSTHNCRRRRCQLCPAT